MNQPAGTSFKTTVLTFFGKVAKWGVVSLVIGFVVTWALLGIIRLLFPVDSLEWDLGFTGLWIAISFVIGIPPHRNPINDPKYGCLVNILSFIIVQVLSAVVLFGIGLVLTYFFDKGFNAFMIGHWATMLLGIGLYSSLLGFGDRAYVRLMEALP